MKTKENTSMHTMVDSCDTQEMFILCSFRSNVIKKSLCPGDERYLNDSICDGVARDHKLTLFSLGRPSPSTKGNRKSFEH